MAITRPTKDADDQLKKALKEADVEQFKQVLKQAFKPPQPKPKKRGKDRA